MRLAAALYVALVLGATAAGSASAQVVALDGGDRRGSAGPVLAGGRVVFGDPAGRVLRLFSAAPDGAARQQLPSLSLEGELGGWDMAAEGERVAVRLARQIRGSRYRTELFAGRLGEPLTELASGLREHRRLATEPVVWVAGDEVITLERTGPGSGRLAAIARTPGEPPRPVTLPPGADPRRLAVTGGLVAAPVPRNPALDRAVVVADLATGVELRRIPVLGTGAPVKRIGLGADGSVAFSSEVAGAGQVLFWSPPGASGFAVYDAPAGHDGLVVSGRRAAIVAPAPGPAGQRVAVVDLPDALPPDLRRLHHAPVSFAGPVHAYVRSLAFDGSHVAWASDHCQLVAAVAAAPRWSIPRGPCLRTEIQTVEFDVETIKRFVRRRVVPVEIRCISGPGRLCRVRATAFGNVAIGSLAVRVRQGRARRLRVPIRGTRALRALRRQPDLLLFCFRMRDPSGRTGRTGVC